MTCKARQYSDQMSCSECGLVWDMNDDDPPECGAEPPPLVSTVDPVITRLYGQRVLNKLKRLFVNA